MEPLTFESAWKLRRAIILFGVLFLRRSHPPMAGRGALVPILPWTPSQASPLRPSQPGGRRRLAPLVFHFVLQHRNRGTLTTKPL